MKRIITVILSVSLFLLMVPYFSYAEEDISPVFMKDLNEYRVLNGLGVIPEKIDETAAAEDYVTRGEFAAIIYNIINREIKDKNSIPSEWNEAFCGATSGISYSSWL